MSTLKIHIITTTYGTWLPGDDRGHWSPLYDFYGNLLKAGHRLNMPDATTRAVAEKRLIEAPKVLADHERFLVAALLANHFRYPELPPESRRYMVPANALPGQGRGYMKPKCYAAAIEENHVHLLLGPVEEDLDRFVGRLKGATSSALKKLPANGTRTHHWTAKFWRVFLYDNEALHAVHNYITNHNRRRGISPCPYDWLTRLT